MFTITHNEQVTEFETLADARTRADEIAIENAIEIDVIHTETDSVAYVATPVRGRNFRPFERVESPKFQAPHVEGYRPAYTRSRIQTVVYRRLDEKGWLVLDTRSNTRYEVSTTAQARKITNDLRASA